MVDATLHSALPFGIPVPGRFGATVAGSGVQARLRAGHSIVLLQPFRRKRQSVSERLEVQFGIGLPPTGRAYGDAEMAVAWTCADTWLATSRIPGLARRLSDAVAQEAAIFDQSDGRCLFRLGGRDARRTLEKGTTLDLHPRAFAPGHSAATTVAHVPVNIRQIDAAPTYEIVVSRSLAADFWHWLNESAGEFGLDLAPHDA